VKTSIHSQGLLAYRQSPARRTLGIWGPLGVATLLAVLAPASLLAQSGAPATRAAATRRLSIDEALRMAETQSEAVQIARAGVTRATGQQYQARSQYLPQLSGNASYARTLRSPFSALANSGGSAPDTGVAALPSLCSPRIPANATAAERNAALAQSITCAPAGGGIDFTKVGFGAPNQWSFGLSLSQNVFAGGRIASQNQVANASARAATIEVMAQRAQLALDVTQAYYDAALADRLVTITESALSQTEEILRQTRVARQVGNQSEFELLRAQVSRDNQLPVVIQTRGNRQVAYLRLKQLLNVSLDDSLQLTTALDDSSAAVTAIVSAAAAIVHPGATETPVVDTTVAERAPVRQLAENVRAQEALVRAARGQRFPAIQITSGYQRLFYPISVFPTLSDFRENWTIGASLSVPIFTGGRIRGEELVAEANLAEARARLQQTREFAALDVRVALNNLEEAQATLRSSQGTTEQAVRAYSIDQIRYREGISTQTDLTQSRLLMEQSLANRAIAARDVAVARVRLALIRDLPLQAQSAAGAQVQAQAGRSGTSTGAPSGAVQPQQSQPRTPTQAAASVGGGPGGVQP
jgi:outer membrane protein